MRSMTNSATLLAALALAAGSASAQKVPLDKIVMESFVSEPAQIPPGATQVVLRATVKNVTNSNLAAGYVLNGLKLRIFRTQPTPEILEMETTINNLAAGATQSAGARVNVGPGVRKYRAVVDPDNTLHEPLQQSLNNERRIELTVPVEAPPGPGPVAGLERGSSRVPVADLVKANAVKSVAMAPGEDAIPGVSVQGTITLYSPAGPSGQPVSLSSSSDSIRVPPSVTVAPGSSTANFTMVVPRGASTGRVTVSAVIPGSVSLPKTVVIEVFYSN